MLFSSSILLSQPQAPSGKKWQSVQELSDEFNSFNSGKWQKGHPYWSGRSPSQFNNNNVTYSDGKLRIRASVRNANRTGDWIWTGCLTSNNKSFKKGMYAEARVKHADLAIVSSFWMQGDYSEIDVMENWGEVKNSNWSHLDYTMEMNTHYFPKPCGFDCDQTTQRHHRNAGNVKNSEQYARYGVWWKDAQTVIWYRNGQEVARATPAGAFNEAMYMFFDMEAFTWGPGLPEVSELGNSGKSTAYYDWVHTYELVNDNSGGSNGGNTSQSPYNGNRGAIPGTIQVENYDLGGEGVAYHDTSNGNSGGKYRNDNVDIESRDGGNTIGWTASGEWLEYTVNATSGSYKIEARVAAISAGKKIKVILEGVTLGTITVPNTNGWGNFQTVSINNINVSGGNGKILRLELENGGVNMNWVKFSSANSGGGSNGGGNPANFVIEAESFTDTGGSVNDAQWGGPGLGVNKASSVINYVNNNDWTDYQVNVPATGTYNIVYRITSPSNNAQIRVIAGGVNSTTNVPNNGSWDSYQNVNGGTINLTAGNQTIRVLASGSDTWQWNLDKVTFSTSSGSKLIDGQVSDENDIEVFPNPISDQMTISGLEEGVYNVSLYNLEGKIVLNTTSSITNGVIIPVSGIVSGLYILRVSGEKGNYIKKVSVQ